MPVLNKDDFYYLNTTTGWGSPPIKEKRMDTFFWCIRDFSDGDCYYFEFKHGDAFDVFPIETLIPAGALDRIKNKEIMLVLCNSHEAFHAVVEGLYQSLVLRAGIPPDQIVLMSESADILNEIKRVSRMHNVGEIKAEWVRVFEADVQDQKNRLRTAGQQLPTLADKEYTKKFINFNRRWRPHRPALVSLLYANDLFKHGHVSLGESDDGKSWAKVWPAVKHYHRNNPVFTDILNKNEHQIVKLPPMYIDTSDLLTNRARLDDSTDYLYASTYFSVVTETNFYTVDSFEVGRFLSEKTFKPIAQRHPFIIVSVPKMLDTLRALGYKTFSPWIDESYDNELDDSLRLMKIVAEIKRLSELASADLTIFLDNVRSICDYNLKVLMSKTHFITRLN